MSTPDLARVRRWWYAYVRAHPPSVSRAELIIAHAEAVLERVVAAGGDETAQLAAVVHDALGLRIAKAGLLSSSRIPAPVVRILVALEPSGPYGRAAAASRVVATPGAGAVKRACAEVRLATAEHGYSRSSALAELARLDCADLARRPDHVTLVGLLDGDTDDIRYATAALTIVGTAAELGPLASAYRSAPDSGSPNSSLLDALSAILTGAEFGTTPQPHLVPELVALATDPAPGLRALAVRLLARAPGQAGHVLAALADPDGRVAEAAARAAGQLRLGRAASALVDLLGRADAGPAARAAAAWALAAIGPPEEAVPVLSAVLVDAGRADFGLVWPAARALAKRPGVAGAAAAMALLADPTRPRWVGAWLAGQLRHRPAVPALLEALRGPGDIPLRVAAAQALGKLAEPGAVPKLIEAAFASPSSLRREALWALTRIGDPRALDAYLFAVSEPEHDTAILAARGLADIDDPRTVPGLVTLANGPAARPALLGLARRRDPRSVVALVRALNSGDRVARRCASAALVAVGAAEELRLHVRVGDSRKRRAAIWALAELGDPAGAPLLARISGTDRDPLVRARAVAALGRLGAGEDALVTALSDAHPRVRANAATALGRVGADQAREALAQAASDPHADVRDAATAALRRLGPS